MVSFVFSWFIVTVGDSCVTEDLFTLSPGSLPFLVFIFHFFALFLLGRMRSRTWQRAFACCFWTDSHLIRWDQSIPDTNCDYSAAGASWRSSFPQTSTLIPWPEPPFGQGWSRQHFCPAPCPLLGFSAAPPRRVGARDVGKESIQPWEQRLCGSNHGWCFPVACFAFPKCHEQGLARKTRRGNGFLFFNFLVKIWNDRKASAGFQSNAWSAAIPM